MAFLLDAAGILRVPEWTDLPWLVHGFTTPTAGDFTRGRMGQRQTGDAIGTAGMRLRTLRQVHSNRLITVNGERDPVCGKDGDEADGLLTRHAGEVVAVKTADCVPILLLDRGKRVVAAVHAGWRGTAAGIAERAVKSAVADFGCRPESLEAAIGPAIGGCCFEVGAEVAARFDASLTSGNTKPHIDLIEANRRQLTGAGLNAERIWSADICTFCSTWGLYSYRRQGAESGRMLAFAGIRVSAPA